jgi:hypothetical protein
MSEKIRGELFGELFPYLDTEERVEQEKHLKEMVRDFDFDLLHNILKRIGKQSGNKDLPFVESDNISLTTDKKTAGVFYADRDTRSKNWTPESIPRIDINIKSILQISDAKEIRMRFFEGVLIHEELHAAAFNEACTGYSGMGNNSYELWNEGITEKLALEVTDEYVRATGHSASDIHRIFKSYEIPMLFVDTVIDRISDICGVDKQTVWQALIQGYFSKNVYRDTEFQDSINELFPADFFLKLQKTKDKDMVEGFKKWNIVLDNVPRPVFERLWSNLTTLFNNEKAA